LLVLSVGNDPTLVVPTLERPSAEETAGVALLTLRDWRDGRDDPYAIVAGMLAPGRYAITDRTWASHLLALERLAPDRSFASAGEALPLLRAVKDPEEIDRLRAAGSAADAAFADVIELPFAARSETELAAELDRLLLEHGHQRVDFTIVGSGPNGASGHHEPGARRIAPGDAVVMDFGGVRDDYCSDITRTVFVGEPTDEQREVYAIVRAAQQAAFEAVRPGVSAQDVDRAARAVITEAGYGDRFVHRTGHGIGLEIHEPPYIVEGNATPLEPGMTFSDEPGIYLEGRFGVRIEDQVVVTVQGAERLNEASRDLTIVA
jgi:Xaa-Pro aminopeptidase